MTIIYLEKLYGLGLQGFGCETGQWASDVLFRMEQQRVSPEDTARVPVGFHQSLHQLLVLSPRAGPAPGDHRQMVQPIVFVLLMRHQQVRRALVSRKDANRSLVRAFRVSFLAVAVRHVLDLFHPRVSHVYLSNRILQKRKQTFAEIFLWMNLTES